MFFWAAVFLIIAPIAALFGFTGVSGTGSNIDGMAFVFGFGLMWLLIVMAVSVATRGHHLQG